MAGARARAGTESRKARNGWPTAKANRKSRARAMGRGNGKSNTKGPCQVLQEKEKGEGANKLTKELQTSMRKTEDRGDPKLFSKELYTTDNWLAIRNLRRGCRTEPCFLRDTEKRGSIERTSATTQRTTHCNGSLWMRRNSVRYCNSEHGDPMDIMIEVALGIMRNVVHLVCSAQGKEPTP